MRALVLLVIFCACNSGYAPATYGDACVPDAAPSTCDTGLVCVEISAHRASGTGEEFACSMPCESNADCPLQTCGLGDYSWPDTYTCEEDGFCLITCG